MLSDVLSKRRSLEDKNYGIYKPFELTAGQWHQIVASWNSNEMFLQIDGNLVQRLAKTFPLSFGNNFTLGWDANNSVCGYMRNFKIEKNVGCLLPDYLFQYVQIIVTPFTGVANWQSFQPKP